MKAQQHLIRDQDEVISTLRGSGASSTRGGGDAFAGSIRNPNHHQQQQQQQHQHPLPRSARSELSSIPPPNFDSMQKLFSGRGFEVDVAIPPAEEIRVPLELYTVVQDRMVRASTELEELRREAVRLRRSQREATQRAEKLAAERAGLEKTLAQARLRVEQLSSINADLLRERDLHQQSATSLDDQMRFALSEAEDRNTRLATVLAENDELRGKKLWLEQALDGVEEDRRTNEKAATSAQSRLKIALMATAKLASEKKQMMVACEELKRAVELAALREMQLLQQLRQQQADAAAPAAPAAPTLADAVTSVPQFQWLSPVSILSAASNNRRGKGDADADGGGDGDAGEEEGALASDTELRLAAEDAMLTMMHKAKRMRAWYQARMATVEAKLMEEHDRHSLDEARRAFHTLNADFTNFHGGQAQDEADDLLEDGDSDEDQAAAARRSKRQHKGRAVRALSLFKYQMEADKARAAAEAEVRRDDGEVFIEDEDGAEDGEEEEEEAVENDGEPAQQSSGDPPQRKAKKRPKRGAEMSAVARQQAAALAMPVGALGTLRAAAAANGDNSDDGGGSSDDDHDDVFTPSRRDGSSRRQQGAATSGGGSSRRYQRSAKEVDLVKSALFQRYFKDPNADEEQAAIAAATDAILSGVRVAESMIQYVDECSAESLSLQDLRDRWEAVKHMARARLSETVADAGALSREYTTLLKRRDYFKKNKASSVNPDAPPLSPQQNSSLLSPAMRSLRPLGMNAPPTSGAPRFFSDSPRSGGAATRAGAAVAGRDAKSHGPSSAVDNNGNGKRVPGGKQRQPGAVEPSVGEEGAAPAASSPLKSPTASVRKVPTRTVGVSCNIQQRPETAHWCRNTLIQPADLNEVDGALFALLPKIYFKMHNILHDVIREARMRSRITLPIADPASFIGDGENRTIADVHCALKFDLFALMALRDLLRMVGRNAKGSVTSQELRERVLWYKECVESQRMVQLDERYRIDSQLLKKLNIVDRRALQKYRAETTKQFKMPGALALHDDDDDVTVEGAAGAVPQHVQDTLRELNQIGGVADPRDALLQRNLSFEQREQYDFNHGASAAQQHLFQNNHHNHSSMTGGALFHDPRRTSYNNHHANNGHKPQQEAHWSSASPSAAAAAAALPPLERLQAHQMQQQQQHSPVPPSVPAHYAHTAFPQTARNVANAFRVLDGARSPQQQQQQRNLASPSQQLMRQQQLIQRHQELMQRQQQQQAGSGALIESLQVTPMALRRHQ